jgi:vacuolar-type H+-ATPase catalytic subunit A/Vma1
MNEQFKYTPPDPDQTTSLLGDAHDYQDQFSDDESTDPIDQPCAKEKGDELYRAYKTQHDAAKSIPDKKRANTIFYNKMAATVHENMKKMDELEELDRKNQTEKQQLEMRVLAYI